jgi:hypothetical protein
MAIFRKPEELIYFLITHKIIFILTLIYVILVIVLSFKIIPKK